MADACFINNNNTHHHHPNPHMLRFRPIAPKPITGVSVPRHPPTLAMSTRSKRKYVARRRKAPRGRIRRRDSPCKPVVAKQALVLPPGKADGSSSPLVTPRSPLLPDLNEVLPPSPPPDPTLPRCRRVLETWLIVESVERVGLEQQVGVGKMTDEERVSSLGRDRCPGLVTDEDNLIRWVNGACERMVREKLWRAGGGVAAVWMVTREDLPYGWPEFTCRVRIVYTWEEEGRRPMRWGGGNGVGLALCDAWRLESGGFAWRLDVEAALTL